MAAYGVSNVVGYASHLPTKTVRLPLKYMPLDAPVDVSEKFKNDCLAHSELVDLAAQKGAFFPALLAGFTNDMRSVWLSPLLVDEPALLGLQFQNLRIDLPHPIISNRTFACQFVANNSSGEPFILLDIIDQSFLLLTLRIELSDFIVGNGTNRLNIDNFSEWVNISVPYSFELRSSPLCVKPLDPYNIIVSMKDGGLLHFRRLQPLGSIDIFDFAENTQLMPLNLVSLLFKGSKNSDVVLNDISSSAAVDIVKLSSSEFVALSATRLLTFWSLDTHKQSRPKLELGGAADLEVWLSTVPNRYLHVSANDQGMRLSLLLPCSDHKHESSGAFEIFEWMVSDEALTKLNSFVIDETPTANGSIARDASVLIVQDYRVVTRELSRSYFFLWKCNTYSSVVCYDVNAQGAIENVRKSQSRVATPLEELMTLGSDAEVQEGIFKLGAYDDDIVRTALKVFEQSLGADCGAFATESLRNHLVHVINATSEVQGVSANSLWYKFALICEEFKKLSQEALAVLPINRYVLTAQVNGLGVFRPPHFYEEYSSSTRPGALSALLSEVASKFSLRVFKQVLGEIRKGNRLSAADATMYATNFLSTKISDAETQRLMEQLGNIPDVVNEIRTLVDDSDNNILVQGEASGLASGEGCGILSKIVVVDAFKGIKKCHEHILLNLFVLLLLCEVNDKILDLLNAIISKFVVYSLMTQVFELAFEDSSSSSPIENNAVARNENSVFWKCAVQLHRLLWLLILRKDYNSAFDYYCHHILFEDREAFTLDVFLELLNRNEMAVVLHEWCAHIDLALPVIRFLFGLVHLYNHQYHQAYEVFKDYDTFLSFDNNTVKQQIGDRLSGQKVIKHFLSAVFATQELLQVARANYFHQVSQLFVTFSEDLKPKQDFSGSNAKAELLSKSVAFEKEAIEALSNDEQETSNSTHDTLKTTYVRHLFANALDIESYNDAIHALMQISELVSPSDMKVLLSRLIRTLLTNNHVGSLFSGHKDDLFRQHYLLVDTILLEIANEDLILSNALTCYEYLYLWRLLGLVNDKAAGSFGDVRGAAEALYIFITRFKLEKELLVADSADGEDYKQFKLRILELYKIIINCLKTFRDTDDRWIIRRDSSKKLVVATVDELTVEYCKWLKELETELA